MPTNISNLSVRLKLQLNGSTSNPVIGADYSAQTNSLNIIKSLGPYTSTIADNLSLGADELYSAVTIVGAGLGFDFNLQSFVDFLNTSGISLVRLKAYVIRLLSVADDSTVGTACSGVSINAPVPAPLVGAAVPSGSGGSLPANTYFYKVTSLTAAGETTGSNEVTATTTGSTSEVTLNWGLVTDATGYNIYRSTTTGAELKIGTVGSGSTITYTDAAIGSPSGSVPSSNTATVANLNTLNGITNFTLGNGDALAWGTPSATGIAVGSTSHLIHFQNIDHANGAALELTFIGGTV